MSDDIPCLQHHDERLRAKSTRQCLEAPAKAGFGHDCGADVAGRGRRGLDRKGA
jgi:hypothetical protein